MNRRRILATCPRTHQILPLRSCLSISISPQRLPIRPFSRATVHAAQAPSPRPRPSQPNQSRSSLKHINYDYHPFANQDAAFFRSRDKTWPMTLLTQRRLASTDPLSLWWRVRVPKRNNPLSSNDDHSRSSHPFKLRTIRSWAGRRVRNVMLRTLEEKGLDRRGAVIASRSGVDKSAAAGSGCGGEGKVSLMGTLIIYPKESILNAKREEVSQDVEMMLTRLEHDVRIRCLQGKAYVRTGHSSDSPARRPLASWVDARSVSGRRVWPANA